MKSDTGTIYLGQTADKLHVYAEVTIKESDGAQVTFTDHSKGPRPDRVSIVFTTATVKRGDLRDIPDSRVEGCGQIPAEDRIIFKPATEHVAVIERAWTEAHLNDMNAACDHMTGDMLSPSKEALDDYAAANPHCARSGRTALYQSWALDNVVCPESGYTWGSSWLARTVDPGLLSELREIIAASSK